MNELEFLRADTRLRRGHQDSRKGGRVSIINVKLYRCIGRNKMGQVSARINVVAAGPKHAARTANLWGAANRNHGGQAISFSLLDVSLKNQSETYYMEDVNA